MSSQIGMPMRIATEVDRPRHRRARLENALFVELAVVRQIELQPLGNDRTAVKHDDRVVEATLTGKRRAHDDAGPAISSVFGKIVHRLFAGIDESRLEDEILRRIAADEKLGEENEIGSLRAPPPPAHPAPWRDCRRRRRRSD